MRKLFNPLRHGGRSAILATLASLALAGGGLAASVPPAGASTTPLCVWQPLSLMNNWQSEQGAWNTGDPAYCVTGGMVYLSGSLAQPTFSSNEFAVLPAWARPGSTSYLSVYTFGGTVGALEIDTNGQMFVFNGPHGDVRDFTSLAGVSFPLASVPETKLNLINGWQSAQGTYGTGDPSYFVSSGITHLSGSLDGTQIAPQFGDSPKHFALPGPGSGPDFCTSTEVYTYGGDAGTLEIDPVGGYMSAYAQGGSVYNTDSALFTSLAGVSFPKFGTQWLPLTLTNGWSQVPGHCNAENQQGPAYYVSDSVVYLTGTLGQLTPNGNRVFAVLPPGTRPTHDLYLTVNAEAGPPASLHIAPGGTMSLFGGNAAAFTSLAGLSFQVSS